MKRSSILFSTVLVAIGCLLATAASNGWFDRDFQTDQTGQASLQAPWLTVSSEFIPAKQKALHEAQGLEDDEKVLLAGVVRSQRKLDIEKSLQVGKSSEKSLSRNLRNVLAVPKDDNEEFASLFKSHSTEDGRSLSLHRSRFAPVPFDQETCAAEKQKFIAKICIDRAFRPAQRGPGVKPIRTSSKICQNILQGDRVNLVVNAVPEFPVTYSTGAVNELELGNRLITQTVIEDNMIVADVVYHATTEGNGLMSILAASPQVSGHLRFRLWVSLPETS